MKIFVVSHKPYRKPIMRDYSIIQVGSHDTDFSSVRDNRGDNIAERNSSYCELTALYWIWRNSGLSAETPVGLCHYRRYFKGNERFIVNGRAISIINRDGVDAALRGADIILPTKRRYIIDTVLEHYASAHNIRDLELVREIALDKYPAMGAAFQKVLSARSLHLYNMFVMRKGALDDYCGWLFDVLFTAESAINVSAYNRYQSRTFGFLAERLFNVWIVHQALKVARVSVVNIEGEQYGKKLLMYMKRKIKKSGVQYCP